MADIAQIGFAADTSGLVKAETALNNLSPAAANAQAATTNVTKSINGVSAAAAGMATQTNATSKVVQTATGALVQQVAATKNLVPANNNATNSNNAHAASHKGLSTQAMAAQHSIRSMVEQLAMGVPVTQVFTTQLNHLSFAATGPGGLSKAFTDAFSSLAKLISGTTLAIAAVGALAVAFAFSVSSVIKSTLALDDLSKSIDVSISKLHGLEQAAAFKGISTDDFAKGMTQFAKGVDEAQHNMGTLNGLMIASGKSAKTFQDYLMNVADLVAKTNNGMQKKNILEAAGLPVTQEWVRFMSQGSKGIQDAVAATVQFNSSAEKNLVQKARDFDDAWNTATTKMAQYFKSAIVDIIAALSSVTVPDWLKTLGSLSVKSIPVVGQLFAAGSAIKNAVSPEQPNPTEGLKRIAITGGTEALKPKTGPDPQTQAQLLAANQQAQARISILGDMATVQQQVTAKQLELNAAGLQGVGVNKEMAAKILNATQATAEQTRVNAQAQIGVFNLAAAQKAATDTLQMWIDKGLLDKNNVTQMAAAQEVLARNIKQTSDAAAVAAAPLQQLKQLELDGTNFAKTLDTTLTGALNNMVSPIQDMLNGVTSLAQGFKNLAIVALKALEEMIIKMIIAKALSFALSGFSGGGVPGSSTLGIGHAAKGEQFANGGAFTNKIFNKPTLFSFAGGTSLGEMGEAGPEAVMPLKRGANGSLGVQMFGQHSNDNSTIAVAYNPTYQLGGSATQEDINNLHKAQAEDRAKFTSNVLKAIPELRKRNARI